MIRISKSSITRELMRKYVEEFDKIISGLSGDTDPVIMDYLERSSYEKVTRHLILAKLKVADYNLTNFINLMRITRDTGLKILTNLGISIDMINAKKNAVKAKKMNEFIA